ncbi:MAG TPA: ExeM/NucH family extracellular endonuclease, partial [Gammaproteobacteria bacterium]|nr:ExeM/NucH family extracellular endonuclease [Gammaproteobacteria bacterium]
MSLQLSGSGTEYESFIWNSVAGHSFGSLNPVQSFTSALPPPPVASCGQPATFISQVQGTGDVSPLTGQAHAVEAVVVGDFQGGASLNGFFVQEQQVDQDAIVSTSEGLFVASSLVDVAVGDVVRVRGVVSESFGLTTLSSVSSIDVCATNATVLPTSVHLPFDPATNNAEWFEGMQVVLPQTLTVSENYNLGRYGEVVVSSGNRLMIPTQVALPGAPALAVKAQNNLNRLVINDDLSSQNPDPVIFPAPALSASNTLRSGDSVTNATGVLSYGFGVYRLEPTQPLTFVADNARTLIPASLTNKGSLRVASFNVLNFFNGDGLGGGFPTSRGANTLQEFERQKAKIVDALYALDADVIGLMEIENDGYGVNSAIQQLVNELNTVAGAGKYAFVNPGVNKIGTDEIAVGMIYQPAKVTLVGAARILDASVDARFLDTKNRPVLAQTLRDNTSGKRVTVAVNHLKSKGSACNDVGDPDLADGQGNCNLTRTRAAQALADWLASDPTGSSDHDILIMGDLNSYAMEDPITALRSAGYTNLIASRLGANAYSYVFSGESGYLDHALA